uniref:Uncharacterized protein n=1 Tax=Salix viminalis TaxID=40686 RepID=A0A6N2L031_SALVM
MDRDIRSIPIITSEIDKDTNPFSISNQQRKEKVVKCGERGSNTRPSDLQSDALPTELSPLLMSCTLRRRIGNSELGLDAQLVLMA